MPGRNSGKHRRGLGFSLSSPQFGVVVLAVNDCPAKVCCQRTCEVYQCSSGFAKNPEMKTNIGFLASKLKCISVSSALNKNCKKILIYSFCFTTVTLLGANKFSDSSPCTFWQRSGSGVDDATCCLPQCIQYQPKCEGDYAPNPHANKTVGQTADVCCKKTCSLYSCSAGSANIPKAQSCWVQLFSCQLVLLLSVLQMRCILYSWDIHC